MRMKRKSKAKGKTGYEIFKGIRKPMPPPTKVMGSTDKKRYDRGDSGWKKDEDSG